MGVGQQLRKFAERSRGLLQFRRHICGDDRRRLRARLLERMDLVAPVAICIERELPAGGGDRERRTRRRDTAHAAALRGDASNVAGGQVDAVDIADAISIGHVVDGLAVRRPLRTDLLAATGRGRQRAHDLRRHVEQRDANRPEAEIVERRREPIRGKRDRLAVRRPCRMEVRELIVGELRERAISDGVHEQIRQATLHRREDDVLAVRGPARVEDLAEISQSNVTPR